MHLRLVALALGQAAQPPVAPDSAIAARTGSSARGWAVGVGACERLGWVGYQRLVVDRARSIHRGTVPRSGEAMSGCLEEEFAILERWSAS